jgi:hypothetical protein
MITKTRKNAGRRDYEMINKEWLGMYYVGYQAEGQENEYCIDKGFADVIASVFEGRGRWGFHVSG